MREKSRSGSLLGAGRMNEIPSPLVFVPSSLRGTFTVILPRGGKGVSNMKLARMRSRGKREPPLLVELTKHTVILFPHLHESRKLLEERPVRHHANALGHPDQIT
eukprot:1368950-Amorphochlora_amoeboformis.AAC.1